MGKCTQTKLVIDSRLESIASVRHWAAQQAYDDGFDAKSVSDIELAVGEALANVVQHAYAGQAGHEIHLYLTIDETKFSLTIHDFGRKFDLTTYTPPNLEIPTESGYGVYLIQQAMDEVTYNISAPQGTQLDLVKYRPGSQRSAMNNG